MMAGSERKHSPMQKHVRFNLGTNTRGKSHPDELASNYNEIKVERLADNSTSFNQEEVEETSSKNIYTNKELQTMKMAMPGQLNREGELAR